MFSKRTLGAIIRGIERRGKAPNLARRPYEFGRRNRRGWFKLDPKLLPRYKKVDLTNFELKPYVSHLTPQVPKEDVPYIRISEEQEQKN